MNIYISSFQKSRGGRSPPEKFEGGTRPPRPPRDRRPGSRVDEMPCLRAYAPSGIPTHDLLIASRENEPLHHSAPTVSYEKHAHPLIELLGRILTKQLDLADEAVFVVALGVVPFAGGAVRPHDAVLLPVLVVRLVVGPQTGQLRSQPPHVGEEPLALAELIVQTDPELRESLK